MTLYDDAPPSVRSLSRTLTLLIALALAMIGYLAFRAWELRGTPAIEPRPITPAGNLADDEKSTIELFNQSAPSVVFITRFGARYSIGFRPVEVRDGTGPGSIWDDAGDIVTNFHVIQGASNLTVTLSNHETYRASVVGVAPEFDLAVLRINTSKDKVQPLRIGSSSDLKVGQKVFAIGNPFGLDQTLTTGIVSATGRTIRGVANNLIEDVIQTDAAINPGNSGGPLIDSAGRLIGVNTAIYSESGSSAGIGFAVPVDTVNRIVPQLIANGRIVLPELGVTPANDRVNANATRQFQRTGIVVVSVQPGSPADRAGIRGAAQDEQGGLIVDFIREIDGRPIRNAQELFTALARYNVGSKVTITVFRNGEEIEIPVTLDASTPIQQ